MGEKRRKKKLNKGRVIRNIVIIVIVLGLIVTGVIFLRKMINDKYAEQSTSELISVTAQSGSISTTVYGSGRLSDDDVETVKIPDSVEIDELRVAVGDTVAEGDVLATVDSKSVISAMSVVQSEIDAMDAKLEEAEGDEIESKINAPVSGRVKEICVAEGDAVATVMSEKNALMVISADGYMAVDLSGSSLAEGDDVTVKTSDGTEYSGSVKYVSGGNATVLFSDQGPQPDEKVTVVNADAEEIGSGNCYINSPVTVVSYGGTVEELKVEAEDSVKSGDALITLTDTEYTINYEAILKERKKLEASLSELLEIYKKGAVVAAVSGRVSSVPSSSETSSSSESDEKKSDTEGGSEFKLSPDKTMTVSVSVDETDILSLEIGQEADVLVSSIGDEAFKGTITAISKNGSSSNGSTQYTADIQIEKQEKMLEGMSAEAGIKIQSVDNTIYVAKAALNETSSSAYVYTSYDEETGELGGVTEVTVGIANNNYVEIVDGLTEGETIYYKEKQTTKNSNGRNRDFSGMSSFGGSGGSMPSMPGGSSSFPGKEREQHDLTQ